MHPVMLAEKLWGWGKWVFEWEQADVLVLDEISMVDCDLLETVSKSAVVLAVICIVSSWEEKVPMLHAVSWCA